MIRGAKIDIRLISLALLKSLGPDKNTVKDTEDEFSTQASFVSRYKWWDAYLILVYVLRIN